MNSFLVPDFWSNSLSSGPLASSFSIIITFSLWRYLKTAQSFALQRILSCIAVAFLALCFTSSTASAVTLAVGGSSSISGSAGSSSGATRYSMTVTSAPKGTSECTVNGQTKIGPWSGPSWGWNPSVSDSTGISVTLSPTPTDKESVDMTVSFLKQGDYTITLTGTVYYSSTCGGEGDGDSKTINVHVSGKAWDVGDEIEGGDVTAPVTSVTVDEEENVFVGVSTATDSDHWTDGTQSDNESDSVTYSWTAIAGSFSSPTNSTSTWTAPTLPEGAKSQTYTLKCTVDDTPTAIAANEGGTRDDEAKVVTVSVTVTQKVWDKGTGISPGTFTVNGVSVGNYIEVDQGSNLSITINSSTDVDHWSYRNTEDTEADDLTYTWTSSMGGGTSVGQSVSFNSGTLPAGIDGLVVTLTCKVDDTPKVIAGKDSGSRDDDSKSPFIVIKTVRKIWSPGQGIQGGSLTSPDTATISPGGSVSVSVSTATDVDAWTKGLVSGTEPDTITYNWSGDGAFISSSAASTTWTPPTLPSGTNSKVYTLTCTINDTPIAMAPGEGGSRNDSAITRTVKVKVVRPYWLPLDKEIGFHPQRDINNMIIMPYNWLADGRMIAPIDQREPNPKAEKVVYSGELVACEVEGAKDYDTFFDESGSSVSEDSSVTYTWSATAGKFRVQQPDLTYILQDTAVGATATWVAPDNLTTVTNVQITCSLNDADGDRVIAPISGSHDDEAVARQAQVKVIPATGGAYLSVLKADDELAGSVIGGNVKVALVLDLDHTSVVSSNATVRISEKPDAENGVTHPASEDHRDIKVDFTSLSDWQKFVDPDGAGPLPAAWVTAPEAPKNAPTTDHSLYRYLIPWKTADTPLTEPLDFRFDKVNAMSNELVWLPGKLWNHNGVHTLSLSSVDGVADAELDIAGASDLEVASRDVTVGNLSITDISSNNSGTSNYFRFDPDAPEGSNLRNPVISFKLNDDGDFVDHVYRVRVRVRSTDDLDEQKSIVFEKIVTSPGTVNMTINQDPIGAEIPLGPDNLPVITKLKDWGTCNFQIQVLEYSSQSDADADITAGRNHGTPIVSSRSIDKAFSHSEFLSIPYKVPGTNTPGHSGKLVRRPLDNLYQWLLSHYFADSTRGQAEMNVSVDVLNPDLSLNQSQEKSLTLNNYHFQKDWAEIPFEDFQLGHSYIAVTSATDDHKSDYRNHHNRPMLSKNDRKDELAHEIKFDLSSELKACAGGTYDIQEAQPNGTMATVEKHRTDVAHVASVSATLTRLNLQEKDVTKQRELVPSGQLCQIKFTVPQLAEGARLISKDANQVPTYEATSIEALTLAGGKLNFQVLSSRLPRSTPTEIQVSIDAGVDLTADEKSEADKVAKAAAIAANAIAPSYVTYITAYAQAYAQEIEKSHQLTTEQKATLDAKAKLDASKAVQDDINAGAAENPQRVPSDVQKQALYILKYAESYSAGADQLPDWVNLTPTVTDRYLVIFDRPESKRLFGIKEWNQVFEVAPVNPNPSETTDDGWEFDPPQFTSPAPKVPPTTKPQIMKCRLYLRFRKGVPKSFLKDTVKDENAIIQYDDNYFIIPAKSAEGANPAVPEQRIRTLDRDAVGTPDYGSVSLDEWEGANARGSQSQPLTDVTFLSGGNIVLDAATPPQPIRYPLWLSVKNHVVRVKIAGTAMPNENLGVTSTHAPLEAWSPLLFAFCKSATDSTLIKDDVNRNGMHTDIAPIDFSTAPNELTVADSDGDGIVEFYICANSHSHRATQFTLEATDISIHP